MAIAIRSNSKVPAPAAEPFHDWARNGRLASTQQMRSAANEEAFVVHILRNVLRRQPAQRPDASEALLEAGYRDFADDDLGIAEFGRAAGLRGLNRAEQE